VEAVIVHGNMLREAERERRQRRQRNLMCSSDNNLIPPSRSPEAAESEPLKVEEVLVMQLHYRAKLLNESFQREVLRVIQLHKATVDGDIEPSTDDIDGFESAEFGQGPSLQIA
jgi:hypothetical protein